MTPAESHLTICRQKVDVRPVGSLLAGILPCMDIDSETLDIIADGLPDGLDIIDMVDGVPIIGCIDDLD